MCKDELERGKLEFKLHKWIKDWIPHDSCENHNVMLLTKVLVASLSYHKDFLMKNIHPNSNFRCCSFMNSAIPSSDLVIISYPGDKIQSSVHLTGIPPHTSILAENEELKNMIRNLQTSITENVNAHISNEFDRREIGGEAFVNSQKLNVKMDEILKIVDELNSIRMNEGNHNQTQNFMSGVYTTSNYEIEEEEITLQSIGEDRNGVYGIDENGTVRMKNKRIREETQTLLKGER